MSPATSASTPPAVLWIHQGDSFYLAHSLAQARQSNPGSRLILLGDQANRYYRGVEFYPYQDYFQTAEKLGKLYRHRNPVPEHEDWLRFCFQKWAVMRDFMKAEGVKSSFIVDTDTLIFGDLGQLEAELSDWGFTVSRLPNGKLAASAALTLERDISLMDQLVEIMFEMFEPGELSRQLDEEFEQHGGHANIKNPAAVTEMVALGLLYERNRDRVLNTCPGNYFGSQAIDHNMMVDMGWAMQDDSLRLSWKGDLPHGTWLADSREIPLLALHCSGKGKWMMKDLMRLRDPGVIRDWKRNYRVFLLRKYARKLRQAMSGGKPR